MMNETLIHFMVTSENVERIRFIVSNYFTHSHFSMFWKSFDGLAGVPFPLQMHPSL